MKRLHEIGFQKVGQWRLAAGELTLELASHADTQNVLYAFVSAGAVKYVGKSTQTLRRRMTGYLKPNQDQRTNWRNRLAILELLGRGETVDILALPDSGLLRYGAFHLNVAAGLEDSIIQILKPAWNGGRTSAALETPAEVDPPASERDARAPILKPDPNAAAVRTLPVAPEAPAPAHDTAPLPGPVGAEVQGGAAVHFTLTLQETYHRTGFFNVPIGYDRYFGRDAQGITIYCGKEALAVSGKINRTANTNGTPRIMGAVPLRAWFQKRKVMSQLRVSIVDPSTIRIHDLQDTPRS